MNKNLQYISIKTITDIFDVSQSSIARWRMKNKDGKPVHTKIPFPEPINISPSNRNPRFNKTEVIEWFHENFKRYNH